MDKLHAAYRVVVIIGLAIMASVLVYAVIVGLFENGTLPLGGEALPEETAEIVKFACLGIAALAFPLMRFLSNKAMNSGSAGPEAGGPGDFGPLTVAAVITFAFCEMPAIFGLVLYILTRNATDFYLFFLISLFYFATNFPKYSQWEEWLKQRQGRGAR